MPVLVSTTSERRMPASPSAVWSVISDPAMQEWIDPRCRLESVTGRGGVGSEFVLSVRAGLFLRSRLTYLVVEWDAGTSWAAEVTRGGKHAGVQRGELEGEAGGTLVRWTVTISTSRLTRRLARASCERELPRWLASVEREALRSS